MHTRSVCDLPLLPHHIVVVILFRVHLVGWKCLVCEGEVWKRSRGLGKVSIWGRRASRGSSFARGNAATYVELPSLTDVPCLVHHGCRWRVQSCMSFPSVSEKDQPFCIEEHAVIVSKPRRDDGRTSQWTGECLVILVSSCSIRGGMRLAHDVA